MLKNGFIRFFDIFFSFFAILVLFPFMLPIMLILKMTGEHYIFYKQIRVGRYGEEFSLLKFATMLKNSPNLSGGYFTSVNDPRILPLGKFLRKTKINELPQLINILIGDMSIVGYRPLVRQHFEIYPDEIKRKLYNIRPGLSGIGSIVLRNEEYILQKVDNPVKFYTNIVFPYKVNLENWFANNNSLFNYFKIIFVTVVVVLRPDSNLARKAFKDIPIPPNELIYQL
jgi:lipopolysaccharide/colanic/teichoic acid biosynthesis glycosyltransferase